MTRTEWDWLIGKPSDETMLVIDDGVLAMLDEYVKKKCTEAFQRGAEAMREAAASHFSVVAPYDYIAPRIRALPDPEDTE